MVIFLYHLIFVGKSQQTGISGVSVWPKALAEAICAAESVGVDTLKLSEARRRLAVLARAVLPRSRGLVALWPAARSGGWPAARSGPVVETPVETDMTRPWAGLPEARLRRNT